MKRNNEEALLFKLREKHSKDDLFTLILFFINIKKISLSEVAFLLPSIKYARRFKYNKDEEALKNG